MALDGMNHFGGIALLLEDGAAAQGMIFGFGPLLVIEIVKQSGYAPTILIMSNFLA